MSSGFVKNRKIAVCSPCFLWYNRAKSQKGGASLDNYELSRDRAQAYFLNFDQQKLISFWKLRHNQSFLYVSFFNRNYTVNRATGQVLRDDGQEAGFEEVLSIFDFLCHEGEQKLLSGRWAPVNSLEGLGAAAGVGTNFHGKTADRFDRNPQAFRTACEAMGGEEIAMGDIGYRFPVFGDFSIILKFYHSDEDFPASATILWDANTLRFLFYETTFYISGFLLKSIAEHM